MTDPLGNCNESLVNRYKIVFVFAKKKNIGGELFLSILNSRALVRCLLLIFAFGNGEI